MNTAAERHLTKAKNYLDKGDEFYRKAKPEIEAALASGATQREVARFLSKSHTWVADVVAWDGKGTLYGKDTARRQQDMAKQYITEAPMEQVERIIEKLPRERQQAIAAAAGSGYHRARQEFEEKERNLTPAQRQEREANRQSINELGGRLVAPFASMTAADHLDSAREILTEMISTHSLSREVWEPISTALDALLTEAQVAAAMVGLELDLEGRR